MFKEIRDLKNTCENIVKKSDSIKNLTVELINIIDEIKSKTSQENAVGTTLSIRKELATTFILNSDIEDNFKTLQKISNSIKKLQTINSV